MTEVTNEAPEKTEMTVDVDGVQHKISSLSAEVQDMLKMHQSWSHDLAVANDKTTQLRAAVQQISNQIVEAIRAETAEEASEAAAPTGTPSV